MDTCEMRTSIQSSVQPIQELTQTLREQVEHSSNVSLELPLSRAWGDVGIDMASRRGLGRVTYFDAVFF